MKTKKAKKPEAKPVKTPPALPPGCDALLSRQQICFAIGVSIRTFQGMLAAKEFPPADTRVGLFPRWRVATLNEWISGRCVKPKE